MKRRIYMVFRWNLIFPAESRFQYRLSTRQIALQERRNLHPPRDFLADQVPLRAG